MKTKILYLLAVVASSVFLTTSCAQTYGYSNYGNYDVNTGSRVYQRGVTVETENPDVSYNLDLRAVANVFADSRDLEEFEMRINDYEIAINNLDLNNDGQVDYLRVIETRRGNTHLVVLQAVLDYDIYQDVASIAVERRGRNRTYVQIIGDPFIYGPRYIIEPVYVYTPTIYSFFWGASYYTWSSPYYWGYYPRHYHFWNPRPYRVYANNVNIYIDNSRHTYNYADNVRSNNYATLYNSVSRSDLARQHPDRSFASRNARANVNNRRDLDVAYRTSSRSGHVGDSRSSSRSSRSSVYGNSRSSSSSGYGTTDRSNSRSSRSSQMNSDTRERSGNYNSGNSRSSRNSSSNNVRSSSRSSRDGYYNSGVSRSSSNGSSGDVRSRTTSSRNSGYSSGRSTRTENSSVNRGSYNSSRSSSSSPVRSNSSRNSSFDRGSSSSSRSSVGRVSSGRSGSYSRGSGTSSSSRSSEASSSRSGSSRSSSSRSSR